MSVPNPLLRNESSRGKKCVRSAAAALALAFVLGFAAGPLRAETEDQDLARLLQSGNLAGAVDVSRKAAEAGEVDGQFNLALFYWHGVAVPQNFQEALRWATLAAVGGHPRAMKARAAMLAAVEPAVHKKVIDWVRARLQKQGEGGDDRALVLMSVSYAAEFGFEDAKEGYFWAALAVAAGEADARRRRDALVKSLPPADAAKIQDRATEWFTKFRKR